MEQFGTLEFLSPVAQQAAVAVSFQMFDNYCQQLVEYKTKVNYYKLQIGI